MSDGDAFVEVIVFSIILLVIGGVIGYVFALDNLPIKDGEKEGNLFCRGVGLSFGSYENGTLFCVEKEDVSLGGFN